MQRDMIKPVLAVLRDSKKGIPLLDRLMDKIFADKNSVNSPERIRSNKAKFILI